MKTNDSPWEKKKKKEERLSMVSALPGLTWRDGGVGGLYVLIAFARGGAGGIEGILRDL